MIDGFDGLRHDAVISCHDKHNNVGDLCTTRTHGRKGSVAWRIDEGDRLTVRCGDLISADVLRNAAGFARHNMGFADRIEQGGRAVIDVTHDRDDRRTRFRCAVFVRRVEQAFFNV